MLAFAGLATIGLVLTAILRKRLSPLVSLAAIPFVAALLLGAGTGVGRFMLDGMVTVAPMAAMFLFAILFFSVRSDAGLFRPIVEGIVRMARDHPPRLALGTAILTTIAHLDGSGASTFLIVVPALVPVYDRLGIDRRMLPCIVAMAAGVGNMLPWGGPTIRAANALQVPVMELFGPVVPVYAVGVVAMLTLSWWIGSRHAVASAGMRHDPVAIELADDRVPVPLDLRYWVNVVTVVAVLGAMVLSLLPPAVVFLLGTVIALLVNMRAPDAQRDAINRHAPAAVAMVAILLAAGSFTGIMRGTGMLDALAHAGADLLPGGAATHLPLLTGVLSMPLSLFFDPDSFYFGVLPGARRDRPARRRPCDRCRARGDSGADDDWLSGEPDDPVDVSARGVGGGKARKPPALHHSVPLRRHTPDAGSGRPVRGDQGVRRKYAAPTRAVGARKRSRQLNPHVLSGPLRLRR